MTIVLKRLYLLEMNSLWMKWCHISNLLQNNWWRRRKWWECRWNKIDHELITIESGKRVHRVDYTLKCFLISLFLKKFQLFDWLNKRYMNRGGMGVQGGRDVGREKVRGFKDPGPSKPCGSCQTKGDSDKVRAFWGRHPFCLFPYAFINKFLSLSQIGQS